MASPEPSTSGRFWSAREDGRLECGICPRHCRLRPGQRGFCGARGRLGDRLLPLAYGCCSGFAVDPIEKKPLHHFLPGTRALSFGAAGCNLACRFCQNWELSRGAATLALDGPYRPEAVARAALDHGCRSVAFTYNEPLVSHEFCVDTAQACREAGLRTVAVSSGYQCAGPREAFYRHMDAANIDLKAFSDRFYRRLCGGRLEPVLETLRYLRRQTGVWLEVTTLVIPGGNDDPAELAALARWLAAELGPDVPLHFSAFHPAWRMLDHPRTPAATLLAARRIALDAGLRHVYLGNLGIGEGEDTLCHVCGRRLIGRDGYTIRAWRLTEAGACDHCGTPCPGVFEARPGSTGAGR
jgi:pyruvate formate lyase activating enzyme